MAAPKSRLGRGLDSLIAGGIRPAAESTPAPAKAVPPAKKAKPAAKTPKKKKPAKKLETAPVASAPQPDAPAKAADTGVIEGAKPFPKKPELPREGLAELPITKIEPNPHQPRKSFDEASLHELAESIRSEGLLQPIVVRLVGDTYQLIAGERRWRACQQLKLKRIPARILDAGETSSAVMSLIENLQRENLNPIEESLGYASLLSDFKLTQEAVAERVGKSRAAIANSLRLLQLDSETRSFLSQGLISVGHAKVLLGLDDAEDRILLARQVIERGLSVRETEKAVQKRRRGGSLTPQAGAPREAPPAETAAIADLERRLASTLSTRVQLKHTAKKGRLVIEYYGNDDLQRVLEKMGLV